MTRINTNTKEFRLKMVEHVLSFQVDAETKEEKLEALMNDVKSHGYADQITNNWAVGASMVEKGSFLIPNHEIEEFLKNELGLTNDKYKDEDRNIQARWELYKNLCGKAVRDAVENTNKLFDQAKFENMN